MSKLIFSLTLILSITAFSKEMQTDTPSCESLNIKFFGEVKWGRVETNEQGVRSLKKYQEILPLPPTHSSHSNAWRRVFLQLPPKMQPLRKHLSVKVTTTIQHTPPVSKALNYKVGAAEKEYFVLKNSQFAKMLPQATPLAPGQIQFAVQRSGSAICNFTIDLVGSGEAD